MAKIPHNHLTVALAGPRLRRVTATLQVTKAATEPGGEVILHLSVALATIAANGRLGGVEGDKIGSHGFKYST